MGRRWRGHSPEYILKHIKFLKDVYNVDNFHFEDDSMLSDMKRAKCIFHGLIDENLDIQWDTPNGVRADRLDEEMVQLMKRTGCRQITLGVESGSQRVLDTIIKKKLRLETVESVAKICLKHDLPLGGFLVIGFPGETKKDIWDTVRFGLYLAGKYRVKISGAMIATPLLGTELFDICKNKGFFSRDAVPRNYFNATGKEGRGMIRTPEFTPWELKRINHYFVVRAYGIIFFRALTNPARFCRLIKNIGSFRKGILYFKRLIGVN